MEYGVNKLRVVVAGFLASLMVCAVAAPALAQANAQGGNVSIQYQFCPQVVNQYANAVQNNTGGAIAAGIAQDLGIDQSAVNICIQNAFPNSPDTNTPDTDPPDTNTPDTPDGDRTPATLTEERGEKIVLSANLPTVLANTGGEAAPPADSSSFAYKVATLLPAGALLAVFGATMFCVVSWRR